MSTDISLYKDLHKKDASFGGNGGGLTDNLSKSILELNKFGVRSILDYGTGKGNLVKHLRKELDLSMYKVEGYDPAIEEWSKKPKEKFDVVTCIDVLEHLEYHNIDQFIINLRSHTKMFCFLLIDLQPAVQQLSNGRNAHTLLAPHEWWASKVAQYFPVNISFPIMHRGGFIQKYIITASISARYMAPMMKFNHRLDIYTREMINPPKTKKSTV